MLARRQAALPALAAVAASADAVSYLGLGHVFTANMTGNTVLLGIGAANRDAPAAIRSAVALGAFVTGAVWVGMIGGQRPTPRAVRFALVAEFAALAAAATWWQLHGMPLDSGSRYGLIVLFGLAMGIQGSMFSWLDVPANATYITGTWAALSRWLASLPRRDAEPSHGASQHGMQGAVLAAYGACAVGTAFLFHAVSAHAAVIPPAVLLLTLCLFQPEALAAS